MIQSEQMPKTGKPEKQKPTVGKAELKDKIKSSERSGLETNQEEQLDILLNKSAKELTRTVTLKKEMPLPLKNETIGPHHPAIVKIL